MKDMLRLATLAVTCCASVTMAADLDLQVNCLTTSVGPDGTVLFEIEGQVTAATNGLALFGVDVTVTGPSVIDHSADIAITPAVGTITNFFVNPGGLTNPAGFGGTPNGTLDSLLQVGGSQNTINNPGPSPPAPTAWPITENVALNAFTLLGEGSISLLGATAGTYTITLSAEFGNVLTNLNVAPDFWSVAQATIINVGSSCQFSVTVVQPAINTVDSVVDHGAGGLPLAMTNLLPGIEPVEPRLNGITQVVVEFTEVMDPATLIPANVKIEDETLVLHSGNVTAVTVSGGDTIATIDMTVLPDQHCYTIDLAGMTEAGGGGFGVPADGQVQIIAQKGDANRDGAVSSADAASVKQRVGQPVGVVGPQYDINPDGFVTSADFASVKQRLGQTAPVCP